MYTVIYSKSPYLLARMATDLQMGKEILDETWNEKFNPFNGDEKPCDYLTKMSDRRWGFHNHPSDFAPYAIRHTLTSRNYLKVLGAILNRLP